MLTVIGVCNGCWFSVSEIYL